VGDVSEVIPEDEDRGGDGAMSEAFGTTKDEPATGLDDDGGTDADDGGPGSQNM
jgi:hypothetical protein